MDVENSTIPPGRNVSQARGGLLNSPPSGQDTQPLLQAFQKIKSYILVMRQLATGEQVKLLKIIDQVGDVPITRDPPS